MTKTSHFAALLSELDTMQKASAGGADGDTDDKKVVDAAGDGTETGTGDGDTGGGEGDETFGKAFTVRLADGTEQQAYDGTAMMKALHTQQGEHGAAMEDMHKAFGMAIDVIKSLQATIAKQDTLLKALDTRVAGLATTGTGRKSMVTVMERLGSGTANSDPAAAPKQTAGGIMMKARSMAIEGKMPWADVARIEAYQGRGQVAPPDILSQYPALMMTA